MPEIRIAHYADWMLDQVVEMFVSQYGTDHTQQRELFRRFYESSFQISNGIRLVALDGQTVCGFQSYFYWPYQYEGQTLRTFQSGNSLVAPAYRGQRIFARLLNFLHEADEGTRSGIDFLMGFPVGMSYGSFLRNEWINPLDLVWYARPVHPLSVFRAQTPQPSEWRFDTTPEPLRAYHVADQLSLSKDAAFVEWRQTCGAVTQRYYYVHHHDARGTVRFELRHNRRGRMNEMIVGDVVRTSADADLLGAAMRTLVRAAAGHRHLTVLTIALNPRSADAVLHQAVRRSGFLPLRHRVHFIVKPVRDFPPCLDPGRWRLLRSDIDTW